MNTKSFFFLLLIIVTALAACATVEKQVPTVYGAGIDADAAIIAQAGYPEKVLRVATLMLQVSLPY